MKILLKSLGFESGEALREHVVRRLSATLSPLADRIGRVVVRFTDENGPKGGPDKTCAITLEGRGLAVRAVSARGADCYGAADLAIRRAGRAATRALEHRYR